VTAQSYTDAAVSNHAAIVATTNSLGHVQIGAGLQIDTNGVVTSSAGAPAWADVTGKAETFPPHLSATQTVIRAATSAGVTIQNSSGAASLTIGAGGTGVTTADGLNVTGALQVGGTNVMTELAGKASTGTVAAISGRVSVLETNTATKAQGVTADGALQRSGGTMTGDITMGTNTVSGMRFGDSSGVGASGSDYSCIGLMSGYESAGSGWHAAGINAGYDTIGDLWHAAGYYALAGGRVTNSAAFGLFAGSQARGNNRMYLDVYPTDPEYPAGGATNDMVFGDNGYLYLGRGGGAPSGAQGGTLRGVWTHSADREPYVIPASTNMIVDRSNTDAQRIASILPGTSTIRFNPAVTNYASSIVLHVPPIGTNTIIMPAGPVYSFGDGLSTLATTNYSTIFAESPVGSTNWAVTIWKGVPQ
jgi:hypothetical protein